MTLTIAQVLAWDVGSLQAASVSLYSSATHITEISAALPKNTAHGGRSNGPSWLASSWSGPSAIAAQGAARDISKNLEGLSDLVQLAGEAISHCATRIDIAQEKIRSVKQAVDSHDSMTLTSDGRVLMPAYTEVDGSDSPFGASDFQGEANNGLVLQGQAQEALAIARVADEQLCSYLRFYFEGVALPNPSAAAAVVSTILDLIPFVGTVKAFIEASMGEGIFTQQILSEDDRLVSALTAGISSVAALRFGSVFMRESETLVRSPMQPAVVDVRPSVATAMAEANAQFELRPMSGDASAPTGVDVQPIVEVPTIDPTIALIDDLYLGSRLQYGTFQEAQTSAAWARDNWAPAIAGLTRHEEGSIELYLSQDYKAFNQRLRDGSYGDGAANFARLDASIADIDSAIAKGVTPEDLTVVRATNPENFDRPMEELIGTTQSDSAFLSASLGNRPVFYGDVTLYLRLPAGSNALYVETLSTKPMERELLLPRDTQYLITDVQISNDGKYVVIGEVVNG